MIGETVDHYRITEKLGEGGMGEVYLAEDTSLRRKVALKFLPAYLENDETARLRFIREARSAAAIDHPYICKIYEVGQVENKHFIVMEYVEGQTLEQWLALNADAERVQGIEIEDAPRFPERGVQLDVARDRVPTLETLHALVERLASWKLNRLQLYMEASFA